MQNKKNDFWIGELDIVTPFEILEKRWIHIEEGKISKISDKVEGKSKVFKLSDEGNYILYPALINSHDHLNGNYFPRIGEDRPYINWGPWVDKLIHSDTVAERSKITPANLYLLGGYKNLLAGTTTVQDHFPHELNEGYLDASPIRILREYCLSHSLNSFSQKWGDGIEIEHKRAIEKNWPFLIHLEEGYDEETLSGVDNLIKMGALTDHTVTIHCIGFSLEDIKRIAQAKANVITCPFSNHFMFGSTTKIKEIIESGINLSLGTDSTASGSFNLLDEMKFLKVIYKEMYSEEISDEYIVSMVTIHPAKALRIDSKLGSIEEGKIADLLLVKRNYKNHYSNLVNANWADISLVFMDGNPVYGDEKFLPLIKEYNSNFSRFKINKSTKVTKGDPLKLLYEIRKAVGFNKKIPFVPIY